ncbi:hypothetical protein E5288_WYG016521 [Bos mutus]|uniref:Uncharacterized protein n=1 Tax=Bos mutus TaxID=72004 RepID=A0A6B0SAS2_9CETA|nr:hypothetical protein [Bos mutus]
MAKTAAPTDGSSGSLLDRVGGLNVLASLLLPKSENHGGDVDLLQVGRGAKKREGEKVHLEAVLGQR